MWKLLCLCLVLLGCAKQAAPQAAASGAFAAGYAEEQDEGRSGRAYERMELAPMDDDAPAPPAAAPAKSVSPRGATDTATTTRPPDPSKGPAPAAARMVYYEGWGRLRVDQLDAAVTAATALAAEVGGKVESATRSRVVLRVPVEQFRVVFPRFLALGDVLERSIRAQDVTEQFTAVELRLRTATATRDRLVALLARAQTEAEKLQLLREIQRLELEIDRLTSQSATLSELASMSRITLELVPREAVVQGQVAESSRLAWLRGLSPFDQAIWSSGRRLLLEVPEGLVRLDPRLYVAESADGARIRGARFLNEPEGSAEFWAEAARERLAPEFAAAEVSTVGAFRVLRLVDRAEEPYVYVVAFKADGARLDLVEVYYPSLAAEERHRAAVLAVFQEVAS